MMKPAGFAAVLLLLFLNYCPAQETDSIWRRETLTNGLFGHGDDLSARGIEISLSATQIYQQNSRGGLSTHRRAGRFAGSYDIELDADVEKLFGIEDGRLYLHTEGSWSKSGGINAPAVGSVFNVNEDGTPRRAVDVTELWYEQNFTVQEIRLRFGKLDLTGGFEHHNCPVSFDCSNFANDETTQFLNGSLKNNPTIPFPDKGLGIVLHYSPDRLWYASAGVSDADADVRETGFRTTFYGQSNFLYIAESGLTPVFNSLTGAYRAGIWYDPRPKANTELAEAGKSYRDDAGFYVTCDQMLYRENSEPQDNQGLGAFFRYGNADGKRNDITNFWSAGIQYQGLFEGRDDDVLGFGFAYGQFSDDASAVFAEDYEMHTRFIIVPKSHRG